MILSYGVDGVFF